MDTSKLVVGQHVPLSDALPGAGTSGVVTEVTKWHVAVAVAARREGVDGSISYFSTTTATRSCFTIGFMLEQPDGT